MSIYPAYVAMDQAHVTGRNQFLRFHKPGSAAQRRYVVKKPHGDRGQRVWRCTQ